MTDAAADAPVSAGIVAGRAAIAEPATTFHSRDVATGEDRAAAFADASTSEAESAAAAAESAFLLAQLGERRLDPGALIRSVIAALEEHRDHLVEVAGAETGLSPERLHSELSRTTGQFALLAAAAAGASGVAVEEDQGDPTAPSLALGRVPLGPVAVFGASNFPFAFGVLGGDTAAALAAGCPVVVKGHPAHPETSQVLAEIVTEVLADLQWPLGWFSLLHGRGSAIGRALVVAEGIAAVAFTGSTRGGLALVEAAASRPVPIPVFAELGGINALYLLPEAAQDAAACDGDGLSSTFVSGLSQSVTGGSGQFCTKPGLLVLVDDPAGRAVIAGLSAALDAVRTPPLLTPGILHALVSGAERLRVQNPVDVLLAGPDERAVPEAPVPAFLATVTSDALRADPSIADELFGPALVVVRCSSVEDLLDLTATVPGGLTATIHASDTEPETALALLRRLRLRAGRVLFGGFPTGVRVGRATTHGGPYPATSAPGTTSVGLHAMDRFLRPVTFQDLPGGFREPALSWR
ncbi:MAG TPA: aldehyde dehydrogenase family protein [Plantibacter sp.]|uniref:aldehyde dehydrogenase family protein n=1 Tax=unclassified Plantibacter TaxID=2624265 RepID=UPI002D19A2DE|nr:aldehyde dehydrogenase family protein [Plantibacter sp.]